MSSESNVFNITEYVETGKKKNAYYYTVTIVLIKVRNTLALHYSSINV